KATIQTSFLAGPPPKEHHQLTNSSSTEGPPFHSSKSPKVKVNKSQQEQLQPQRRKSAKEDPAENGENHGATTRGEGQLPGVTGEDLLGKSQLAEEIIKGSSILENKKIPESRAVEEGQC
ncbi:hypothetical protein Drorol1_Dr00008947, partial [Drosera rotundifolia]